MKAVPVALAAAGGERRHGPHPARQLTPHLFSFCMHFPFRLKDPIATPSARWRSGGTGRLRRPDSAWLANIEWGEWWRGWGKFSRYKTSWVCGVARSGRASAGAPTSSVVSEHFIRLKSNFFGEVTGTPARLTSYDSRNVDYLIICFLIFFRKLLTFNKSCKKNT